MAGLLDAHGGGAHVHLQVCDGLAAAVESGDLRSAQVREVVERHCAPLRDAGVDTVALGCTHYPFAQNLIQRLLGPTVQIIDTADAVARQVKRVCIGLVYSHVPQPTNPAQLQTTGDDNLLREFAGSRLDFPHEVMPLRRDI